MAVALDHGFPGSYGSSTSASITPGVVAAGSAIVVAAADYAGSSDPTAVTDSKGNTYSKVAVTSGPFFVELWVALASTALTPSDTITITGTSSLALTGASFHGLATPLTAFGGSGADRSVAGVGYEVSTSSPVNAGDLVVAVTLSTDSSAGPGAGWTPFGTPGSDGGYEVRAYYQIATAAGVTTMIVSSGSIVTLAIAALTGAPSGGLAMLA